MPEMEERLDREQLAAAKLEKLKRVAKNDLYVFSKYIRHHDLLEESPHREVCEFLTRDILESGWLTMTRKERADRAQEHGAICKLLMLPRGTFKSTIATVDFPAWLHWHDQNLRIMLDNESYKNSKKFLAENKQLIVNNELSAQLLVDDDGEYLLEPNYKVPGGFTEDSIILKKRTIPAKEPSLFCSGVDTVVTGMHPDIIIMDDLVSERNITTDDQIEKVKQHYKFAFSLLEPGGVLIVIGTRYHLNDLYNEILADPSFDKLVRPAEMENGEPWFPSRLSLKILEDLKRKQGIYIFNSQYLLNPLSSENAIFKPEWIQYINPKKVPRFVNTYMTVDLAISQKDSADYTVITVSSVDSESNIYVREISRGRYTQKETADEIFRLYNKWRSFRLLKIGIEVVAYQKAMIYYLVDEGRKRGQLLPIRELRPSTDKVTRAKALQPWFENGAFFLMEGMVEAEEELLKFPLGGHDDIVDTFGYIPVIMRKPSRDSAEDNRDVYAPISSVTGY